MDRFAILLPKASRNPDSQSPTPVTARQAILDPMAPIIKGPTGIEPTVDAANVPPEWWTDALLNI